MLRAARPVTASRRSRRPRAGERRYGGGVVVGRRSSLVSLALLTVYFRESSGGGLHGAPERGSDASCARSRSRAEPRRAAVPRRGRLGRRPVDAKSREQEAAGRERQAHAAADPDRAALQRERRAEAARSTTCGGPSFPQDYTASPTQRDRAAARASSSSRSSSRAARNNGVRLERPGRHRRTALVGRSRRRSAPSTAQVTLITDETSAVSARDAKSGASGILRHNRRRAARSSSTTCRRSDVVERGDKLVTAGWQSGQRSPRLPARDPGRHRHERRPDRHRPLQADPGASRSSTLGSLDVGDRPRPKKPGRRELIDAPRRRRSSSWRRSSQVSVFADVDDPRRRHPTSCSSRSSRSRCCAARSSGACAGFFAGLIVDTATLGTLGLTLAAADARRLLGRPLRRDDRARPHARAVPLRRRRHVPLRARRAGAALRARRARARARSSCSTRSSRDRAQPAADAAGLRARAAPAAAAASGAGRREGAPPLASTRPQRPAPRIPRFLPPDPRVSQPYLLTPKMALRVAILGAVALVVFGVLFLRLWSLQVLAGDEVPQPAQNNQVRTVAFAAPRGPILDSTGRRARRQHRLERGPASGRPTCRRASGAQRARSGSWPRC